MSDIFDLYTQIILDHSNSPKNFGKLVYKTHQALGKNPLCGDMLSLEILIKDDHIEKIAFVAEGCAISKASASLMTECLKNKSLIETNEIFQKFQNMMLKEAASHELGKLAILEGVKKFPMRVKCATLPWHTFKAALNNQVEAVSTEG